MTRYQSEREQRTLPIGEEGKAKEWRKWDLESGYCPYGHPLEVCHTVRKGKYNECKLERNRKLFESGSRAHAQPEYRCQRCRAPLYAGYHVFGMELNCGAG